MDYVESALRYVKRHKFSRYYPDGKNNDNLRIYTKDKWIIFIMDYINPIDITTCIKESINNQSERCLIIYHAKNFGREYLRLVPDLAPDFLNQMQKVYTVSDIAVNEVILKIFLSISGLNHHSHKVKFFKPERLEALFSEIEADTSNK